MNQRVRTLLPILLDLIVPIGGYLLLHQVFGVGDFWSLTLAGAATGLYTAAATIHRRKLDALGLLIFLELALSVVLLFVSRDPRVLLIKPAFYFAVGAVYAIATCFWGKPLVYESGKPFATKGDPELLVAYERTWTVSARFRRTVRTVTAGWGVAFAADAVLRVLVVYSFPPDQVSESFLLSQVPTVAVFVAAIVFTRLKMRPLRPIIEANRPSVV